jgi:hypothetical protein
MRSNLCGFAAYISPATLAAARYSSHEEAHAQGACGWLYSAQRNPTQGVQPWHFQPRPAVRHTAPAGKSSAPASAPLVVGL